ICMKCNPEYAIELREQYADIEGAFHFNKKYWNQLLLNGTISDELIKSLIDHSYEEVIKKFTNKLRAEYDDLR
ncbi:MAG: MmcQ/YjbR family DNA-binding protein, partial [Bacteroides sp.]